MAYPTEAGPVRDGGLVACVDAGSPAERAGVREGDVVRSVDGHRLRDILDWLWHADGERVELELAGPGAPRTVALTREWDEAWGVEFDGVVFDGVRECENACVFCFVAQLPPGLRQSLQVRDEDYRLSFLTGNFITLTGMDDADIDRIVEQRLSPLHVSVHAVSPGVRRRLLACTVEDRALEHLDTLTAAGIELHTQIVLVPGLNDGEELERTLAWLDERDSVLSVGVVPVGLTRHARAGIRAFTPGEAAAVIGQLAPWRERAMRSRGEHWVHASDELHLAAGAEPPPWDDYDGFPQFENGIGMVRAFVDELADELCAVPADAAPGARAAVTLVTGTSFAPVLERLAPGLTALGVTARVLSVDNRVFGGGVSVAGLLTGADIAAAIAVDRAGAGAPYLVPDVTLSDSGLFLDDRTPADVVRETAADVRLIESDAAGLVSALSALASETPG